jgi:hypothetical protein
MDTYTIPEKIKCGCCFETATEANSEPLYQVSKCEMLEDIMSKYKLQQDHITKHVENIETFEVPLFPEKYNLDYREFKQKYIEWCYKAGCFCKCKKSKKLKLILEWFKSMLYMDYIVINKYMAFTIADNKTIQKKYKKLTQEHIEFVREYHELIIMMKYRFLLL